MYVYRIIWQAARPLARWGQSPLCVPSQNGADFDCLQPQSQAVFASGMVNFTGEKPDPLWLPSQKG